jgi:hypothetical protein
LSHVIPDVLAMLDQESQHPSAGLARKLRPTPAGARGGDSRDGLLSEEYQPTSGELGTSARSCERRARGERGGTRVV